MSLPARLVHTSHRMSTQLYSDTYLPSYPAPTHTLTRSAIFYHSEEQKQAADEVIAAVQPKFGSKIVTEVVAASDWYPADKGHQDYYNRNKSRCVGGGSCVFECCLFDTWTCLNASMSADRRLNSKTVNRGRPIGKPP